MREYVHTMANIDRRHVLTGSLGSLALGWVAPSAFAGNPLSGPPATAWAALDARMTGSVVLPTNSAYTTAKQLYNPRWDSKLPLAVVKPLNVADVQQAMTFSADNNLIVAPRSGGHCYVGSSTGDDVMVLDLRGIKAVKLNSTKTKATIGAGAGLYNVHVALNKVGRTIPTGTCPTVGTAGLTLGGGIGPEVRGKGATCDRLVSATCVLADGRKVIASATQNADLFWALRGGGGAQIAVVTDLTYLTHATTDLGQFSLSYPVSAAAKVIAAWAAYSQSSHNTTKVTLSLNANPTKTAFMVRMHGVTAPGDQDVDCNALHAMVGVPYLKRETKVDTYMNTVLEIANGDPAPPRRDFTAGSDVLSSVTAASATALIDVVSEGIRRKVNFQTLIGPLTGQLQAVSATATAFPYRNHAALIQWFCPLPVGSSTAYAAARSWIGYAHTRMGSMSAGGFVNYVEPGRTSSDYFGPNLARLRSIKASYDPGNRLQGSLEY